jgi:hypothetical protein
MLPLKACHLLLLLLLLQVMQLLVCLLGCPTM